jgi:hypothetical protein
MCGATAGLAMMEGMIPLDVDGLLGGRAPDSLLIVHPNSLLS